MKNPLNLEGRRILVTGASSGIGRATSTLLGELGAQVLLVGRSRERLEETAARMGVSGCVLPCDLTSCEDIPKWMKGITQELGPIDGLVHSAGVQSAKPLQMLKPQEISRVFDINVSVALQLCRGFRQKGVVSTPGSIVLISSVMGLVGAPAVAAYAASKGAICSLTKAVATELAREQIRVNCVAPGLVRTEMATELEASKTEDQFAAINAMHPLGIGEAVDVANAIAFLLSNAARWITGTTLVVDGGYTMH